RLRYGARSARLGCQILRGAYPESRARMLDLCERGGRERQADQDERNVRHTEPDSASDASAEERSPGGWAEADEHVDERLKRQEESRLDRPGNGPDASNEQHSYPGPADRAQGLPSVSNEHSCESDGHERVLEQGEGDRRV